VAGKEGRQSPCRLAAVSRICCKQEVCSPNESCAFPAQLGRKGCLRQASRETALLAGPNMSATMLGAEARCLPIWPLPRVLGHGRPWPGPNRAWCAEDLGRDCSVQVKDLALWH
jgi:hypothetical protein